MSSILSKDNKRLKTFKFMVKNVNNKFKIGNFKWKDCMRKWQEVNKGCNNWKNYLIIRSKFRVKLTILKR